MPARMRRRLCFSPEGRSCLTTTFWRPEPRPPQRGSRLPISAPYRGQQDNHHEPNRERDYGVGGGPGIIGNQIIGAGKATASAGAGIVTTAAAGHPFIVGNTIVGFYDDINFITGTTVLNSVIGNMLTDSANYGINNVNVSNAVASFYNRTGNNANGAQGTPGVFLALTNYGEVTAWTTSDYTNVASNLILLTGSPAVGKAYFPSASIGALQLSAVAGGEIDSAYVK